MCEDTCPGHARNGVCNDGRPTPDKDETDSMTIFEVLCDLGTDCSDCGPWVSTAPARLPWAPRRPAGLGLCMCVLPVLAGGPQHVLLVLPALA